MGGGVGGAYVGSAYGGYGGIAGGYAAPAYAAPAYAGGVAPFSQVSLRAPRISRQSRLHPSP